MNDPTPLPQHVAAHVRAMADSSAPDAHAEAAQQRLLAALPAHRRARTAWPRFALAAAACCAVAVIGIATLFGEQGTAFAAAQQRLRDFATLRLQVDQTFDGQPLMRSRIQLDRSGSVRTDVGNEVSVIVDTRSHEILTLLHGAKTAVRTPLPAGPAPRAEDALQWLDAIRDFQGEAQRLPETRLIDGAQVSGWTLDTQGMQITLWADDDGVPRAMQLGAAGQLALDYRFEFDAPIAAGQLSAEIPAGYTLQAADAD